ncbi:GNAT family N-acetyltransferase [Marinobacterium nitratireducens]|uniref:GNAT family N-acetyltransferase n=1 Tax=Marinobacterium nitratireducens TaxID=518897 RepID=A0A918DS83_9GAMM|nr:N-acetylglutaminylglutamine synthetase [Marinobacterium nitratireducens]GGO80803.1 GNAT family N-acetyltransferase [Marinobacterium nitratireducens]
MTQEHPHPMTLDKTDPVRDAVPHDNVAIDCGWGRLLFAHTFETADQLLEAMRQEAPGKRDIAMYVTDPHIMMALAPQELFLDPSHAFRLDLDRYRPASSAHPGFVTRKVASAEDAEEVHNLYRRRQMVPPSPEFVLASLEREDICYFVAEDEHSGRIIGAVTGVDHVPAFDDPARGSSLWALAVDAQAEYPGVGETLTRQLAEHFRALGRHYLDLSVMHDNGNAIRLYKKLGFRRIDTFAIKYKNAFNEPLFIGEPPEEALNPYAKLIVREAQRRGIGVRVIDAAEGYFELHLGGRSLVCRESLSQLTHAVAMSRCDNKTVTHRILRQAGLRVPDQLLLKAGDEAPADDFLTRYGSVVVKPVRGEQGQGISVDIRQHQALHDAIAAARHYCDDVILEQFVDGQDLRIIVIDFKVVAAAVRRPPVVTGTGADSIRALIDKQSRRRQAATGGESRIPLDGETLRCIEEAGYGLDDILPYGEKLQVRRTANLHTGGTIHDVTAKLHPELREAAVRAAEAIDIPVTGLDFLVPDVTAPDYVIIEANERPGLANHEPQPTAERFIDLLFPQTAARS